MPAARAADVVVFPTPPLWFDTVIIVANLTPPKFSDALYPFSELIVPTISSDVRTIFKA